MGTSSVGASTAPSTALNAVCPYFTMFPLSFPLDILRERAKPGDIILDPFCGRGTTNYASRLLGLASIGIDSSPVAAAVAAAKLANTTPQAILRVAQEALDEVPVANNLPSGEFWQWAYDPNVLRSLCRLREALLREPGTDGHIALRAILLGALHGPQPKSRPWYFSNQAQRTYAPKPAYAVRYWKAHDLIPPRVDVLALIAERAERFYGAERTDGVGTTVRGDSREPTVVRAAVSQRSVDLVITSPPYYGLRTYVPDQWLRGWFLGGPSEVDYRANGQLNHGSPDTFAEQLQQVWRNAAAVATPQARLVIRFGGIHDRKADPLSLVLDSLKSSGWSIESIRPAGTASSGRRQALHFSRPSGHPIEEHDVWATLGA